MMQAHHAKKLFGRIQMLWPDHIYLFREPEEVVAMIDEVGLQITGRRFFTPAGVTEERARKRKLPIACAVIAEKKWRLRTENR